MKIFLLLIVGLMLAGCNTKRNKIDELKKAIFQKSLQQDLTVYPDTTVTQLNDGLKKFEIKHNPQLQENRTYYLNDSLFLVEYFFYDEKDSITTIWYENGNKMSEEYFEEGYQHGISTMWFEDGSLRNEYRYKNGKMIYGRSVVLDDENLIDHIDIERNGNVTAKDYSLKGKSVKEFKPELN